MSKLSFAKNDKWIKKYYESRIRENIVPEGKSAMEIEEKLPLRGAKEKRGHKVDLDVRLKSITSKNIFSTLNEKENIDFLAIKAKNAMKRYDFHEAYKVCKKYSSRLTLERSRKTTCSSTSCRFSACASTS